MNKTFRIIWNEARRTWVAASEVTGGRGKRSSVTIAVAALAATLVGTAGLAQAGVVTDGESQCLSKLGTGTWTCQVPNGQGGFSVINGLPDDGTGAQPNWTAVNAAAAAANTGTGALLLGDSTTRALGDRSIAIGSGARATEAGGVALGEGAVASTAAGAAGFVPGTATAAQAAAITATNSTLAAVSVGDAATGKFRQITGVAAGALDSDAVNVAQLKAVSNAAAAGDTHYYSVNDGGTKAGNYNNDGATGNGALAAGTGARAAGVGTVAIGLDAGLGSTAAVNNWNTFVGYRAGVDVTGINNVAVGSASGIRTNGGGNIAVGLSAGQDVTGDSNVGIGVNSGRQANGFSNVGIGSEAGDMTTGDMNIALGLRTGQGIQGSRNIAMGMSTGAGINANDTVAIGTQAIASQDNNIAIGKGAQATGASSISIGTGNVVSGARSGAIGDPSYIDADDSYAIGNNNTIAASAGQSFVLGNNVTVNNANNVVLGNDSADKAAVQVTSASVPGVIATLNTDGTVTYTAGPAVTYSGFQGTASGVVSVGAVGAERQIVNVAPGEISATSTDAINGSQLYAVASAVNTLGGNITTIVNNAQTHYYSVNDGGTKQGNYDNSGASAANSIAVGAGASVSAGAVNSLAVGTNASATTANSVAVGPNATASTDNSVALGAGSTTTAATPTASTTIQGQTYNFAGANPVGVVSVGSAGAERQIQNVAAGQLSATSTDAVNGSQLYATNQAINNIQGGGGIKYFHANSQAADSQAVGAESVAIGPQAVSQGAGSIAIGNSSVSTASNGVALGANATADRVGMAGQKELFSNAVVNSAQGAVSVGSAGSERQITNVAGGTQATDAVNVRQLQAVQQSAVRYDTNVDGTVNHNSVTMGNGGSTGPVTVHNVAPGVAPTDAVNVQQLNQQGAASTAYTDARTNALGSEIRNVAKNAYAGVAAAMAVQMPASYVPGKTVMRLGYGVFKGESAVGVSFRRTSENNAWSLTGGIGVSRAGAAATVGAEWVFN